MVNLEPMKRSGELRPNADVSGMMNGEYAGPCEGCGNTIYETKDFDGVILCPICRTTGKQGGEA